MVQATVPLPLAQRTTLWSAVATGLLAYRTNVTKVDVTASERELRRQSLA